MANTETLTPELVLRAYCHGYFPMARHRRGEIDWYRPDPRAVLPLDQMKIHRSLRKRIKKREFRITFNGAFGRVIRNCSQPREYESNTWINDQIIEVYTQLHQAGFAHSVEAWLPARPGDDAFSLDASPATFADDYLPEQPLDNACFGRAPSDEHWQLAGGLYGLSINGGFFGESMFSRATDSSKVCLYYLVEHLRSRDFVLLDTQISNPHTTRLGAIEISLDEYLVQLEQAIEAPTSFSG